MNETMPFVGPRLGDAHPGENTYKHFAKKGVMPME